MPDEPPFMPLIGGQIWVPQLMPSSRRTRTFARCGLILNTIGCPFITKVLFHGVIGNNDIHPLFQIAILLAFPVAAVVFAALAYERIRKEVPNLLNSRYANLTTVLSMIWILMAFYIWITSGPPWP